MKVDLAILGRGAVTPAGMGIQALDQGQPSPQSSGSLGEPQIPWPVLRVDFKDSAFSRWQREPRLRRASPLAFFLTEAAHQALQGSDPEARAQTGLIVALSAGCLIYSRRFFEGVIAHGRRTASPALFPETVFNSPVSHVATVLGLGSAAYALVGDEVGWVAALKTAAIWLKRQRVAQVLVLGVEEFDPLVLDAYHSARWLRRQNTEQGFLASEGAAGLLVRTAIAGDAVVITEAQDGFVYRTRREVAQAAARLLGGSQLPCYRTARHNWLCDLEQKTTQAHSSFGSETEPYLGEAFTASAAWNTVRALEALPAGSRGLLPVWGLNHQLGLLQLEKRR